MVVAQHCKYTKCLFTLKWLCFMFGESHFNRKKMRMIIVLTSEGSNETYGC